jgi:hypothetical protein
LTNEWINKIWYIYRMEYFLFSIKNNEMPFGEKLDGLEIILSEISQLERQISCFILRVRSKSIKRNESRKESLEGRTNGRRNGDKGGWE